MRTISLFCAIISMWSVIDHTEAIRCYSCQYSDGPGMVGYECVNSPADYNLGPNTVECETGCQTEAQSISDEEYEVDHPDVSECNHKRSGCKNMGDIFYFFSGHVCGPIWTIIDSQYGWTSIWFLSRGCKTKEPGCQSGSAEICVETCDGPDLCNNNNWTPTTVSTDTPTTTISTASTTEIPGTRDCYSCLYSYNPDVPPTCVDDPANASPPNTVRCPPNRFCYIMRQWSLGENVVRSFARGCEVQTNQNGCTSDTFFQTCWTYCTDELCNSGDGTYPLKAVRAPLASEDVYL